MPFGLGSLPSCKRVELRFKTEAAIPTLPGALEQNFCINQSLNHAIASGESNPEEETARLLLLARTIRHLLCGARLSRYRFVRFALDETRETTLALLAECLEELGAGPAVVLSDRMSCLKNGVVANIEVPHPDYLRFAAHFGF
jgi:hypothetical protein